MSRRWLFDQSPPEPVSFHSPQDSWRPLYHSGNSETARPLPPRVLSLLSPSSLFRERTHACVPGLLPRRLSDRMGRIRPARGRFHPVVRSPCGPPSCPDQHPPYLPYFFP